jgi:hypothetical protein
LNSIFENNALIKNTIFLNVERGKSIEFKIETGFVVIATFSIDFLHQKFNILLAYSNKFVTFCVESPIFSENLSLSIAKIITKK